MLALVRGQLGGAGRHDGVGGGDVRLVRPVSPRRVSAPIYPHKHSLSRFYGGTAGLVWGR